VASKVLGEAQQTLFLAQNLKRTLAGRSFDVCIFESIAIQTITVAPSPTRLVDSANLVFTNHTTYYIAVTNLGIIRPSRLICHGMSLLVCVLEVLMAFLGVFLYVCVVTRSCPETHETKISLNLKAIALSGSKFVSYDQQLQCLCTGNKVFSKFLYSSTL
jgi:hypothetical protein